MDVAFKSFVGIDIAKRTLDVHVLPERMSLKQQNDSKGRQQLREKLPPPGECLIVVEATGGYERALVAELVDAGHQVAVVNPRQARDFAKACGKLAKTDRIDAAVLARFGETMGQLPIQVALGRHAEALELHEETLALRKGKLGPDHPDTLQSMSDLASSYAAPGRHAEALKIREETLALRKAKVGPGHPDTLDSMNGLAQSYFALGRHADALQLFEKTLPLRKANLGPDDPDTLLTMCGVAKSLVAVHRGAEAVPLICEAVAKMEKLNRTEPDSLYKAACFRAVSATVLRAADKSASTAHDADVEADRGMAWLKQAVAAGYKDAPKMKTDTDLDALRGREDFKKLVAELDGTKPREKAKP
jgi:tetratricopeptide (TPR) repeat protein